MRTLNQFLIATALLISVSFAFQGISAEQATAQESSAESKEAAAAMEWERVVSKGLTTVKTYRAKVPGGWLVTTSELNGHFPGRSLAFVPDADHSWKVAVESLIAKKTPKDSGKSKEDARARVVKYSENLIAKFDKNQDGKLDREEMKKMARPPSKADKNRDGVVTLDELMEYFSPKNGN